MNYDVTEPMLELGSVSADTKGAHQSINDFENGLQPVLGLSDG